MKKNKIKNNISDSLSSFFGIAILILIIISGIVFIPSLFAKTLIYENKDAITEDNENQPSKVDVIEEEKITHVQIPQSVKAIYMTACVVGTPSFRDELVKLVEETELNSIIIDIKDYTGTISFPPKSEKLKPAWEKAECGSSQMKDFIKELHKKNIYVIGRITVFQDPFYTKLHPEISVQKASDKSTWKDHKGLSFIEVGAREYWDYILELSNESYEIGFDELNFDYVRFPSDGNMNDIYFPFSEEKIKLDSENGKAIVLEEFFKYLDEKLRNNLPTDSEKRPIISADLFGMVTTNSDDLNIGQVLERALPYFDFIAPMVYPSHFPNDFNGWSNPNHYPYEIIEYSMSSAVEKIDNLLNSSTTPAFVKEKVHKLQLRPWLQDFDYGGDYGPEEVKAQIKATYDVGLNSWMLWAPSNKYTRGALESI